MSENVLSAAENKFFESGGETVDKSLTEGLPASEPPKAEPKVTDETTQPAADAPADDSQVAAKPEDIAKQNKEAAEARRKLLADLGAVPLEALQEARQEGKLTKQQLGELQQWKQQIEPILAQLPKPQTKAQEPNPYDPQTQPQEYKAHQEWLDTKQAVSEMAEWKKQRERQEQIQAQSQGLINWASNQAKVFQDKTPDFGEAYNFAREGRTKDLESLGYTPGQIEEALEYEQAQIIQTAAVRTQQGIPTNPAELVYSYAKSRGYTGKKAEDPAITAAAKIQAGQQASGGLKGGSSPKGKISPEELASIDTTTKAGKKRFDDGWKELYG